MLRSDDIQIRFDFVFSFWKTSNINHQLLVSQGVIHPKADFRSIEGGVGLRVGREGVTYSLLQVFEDGCADILR